MALLNHAYFSAPWVKVYLVSGKRCMAKAKTATARRTLDPLYQQQLVFHEKYTGCVLQVYWLPVLKYMFNEELYSERISEDKPLFFYLYNCRLLFGETTVGWKGKKFSWELLK